MLSIEKEFKCALNQARSPVVLGFQRYAFQAHEISTHDWLCLMDGTPAAFHEDTGLARRLDLVYGLAVDHALLDM